MAHQLGTVAAAAVLAAACASVLGIEERRRAPATHDGGAASGGAAGVAGSPGDASGGSSSGAAGSGATAGSAGTGGVSGASGSGGTAGVAGGFGGSSGSGATGSDPCNFVDDDGDGIVDGDGGWGAEPWQVVLDQAMAIGRPGPIQAVGLDGDNVLVAGINGDSASRMGWLAVVDPGGGVVQFDTQPVNADGGVAVSAHPNRPDAAVLFGAGCAACDLFAWRVDPAGSLDGPHPVPAAFRPAVLGLAPGDADFVALLRHPTGEASLAAMQFPGMVSMERPLGHQATAGSIASRGGQIGTVVHTGAEVRVGMYDPGLGLVADEPLPIPATGSLAATRSIAAAPMTSPEPSFVLLTDQGFAAADARGAVAPPLVALPANHRAVDLVEVGGGMVIASLVGTGSVALRRVSPADLTRAGPPDVLLPVPGSMALGAALARTSQGLYVFATNDTSRNVEVAVVRCH